MFFCLLLPVPFSFLSSFTISSHYLFPISYSPFTVLRSLSYPLPLPSPPFPSSLLFPIPLLPSLLLFSLQHPSPFYPLNVFPSSSLSILNTLFTTSNFKPFTNSYLPYKSIQAHSTKSADHTQSIHTLYKTTTHNPHQQPSIIHLSPTYKHLLHLVSQKVCVEASSNHTNQSISHTHNFHTLKPSSQSLVINPILQHHTFSPSKRKKKLLLHIYHPILICKFPHPSYQLLFVAYRSIYTFHWLHAHMIDLIYVSGEEYLGSM